MQSIICTCCKIEQEVSNFSKRSSAKSGYSSICKKCSAEYSKIWRGKNKEKIAIIQERFYENNPDYSRNRHSKNKEVVNERRRIKYAENITEHREKVRGYRKKRKDEGSPIKRKMSPEYKEWLRDYLKNYYPGYSKRNRDKLTAKASIRRANKLLATPKWVDASLLEDIAVFYFVAKSWSNKNIRYHVDHIIPLKGKLVCGLHVPWNLRVVVAKENLSKSNKVLEEFYRYTPKEDR